MIRFPGGNCILFYQDHSMRLGVPANVDWTVTEITGTGTMRLRAPGYGDPKQYGNGKIAIDLRSADMTVVRAEAIREMVSRLSAAELGKLAAG